MNNAEMKVWRIAAWAGAAAVLLTAIAWLALRFAIQSERDRIYRTAWITTHFVEPFDSLECVNFSFGGEVHNYSVEQLLDTTGENMLIEDKPMPFPVRLTYRFIGGRTRELVADSFDCSRCSGAHEYVLWRDSVSYRYHP